MTTTSPAVLSEIYPEMSSREDWGQGRQSDDSFVFIDGGTPREFEEAHIANSRNIPLADLHKFLPELRDLAKGETLVPLCRTGSRVHIAHDNLVHNGILTATTKFRVNNQCGDTSLKI